ncbi:MAG: hypothetical protein AAF961_04055 [Planctomycetota bacterium]
MDSRVVDQPLGGCRRRCALALFALVCLERGPAIASGRPPEELVDRAATHQSLCAKPNVVTLHRSRRLDIHTDLPGEKAQSLAKRLETTLAALAKYWRRPLKGRIVCYVVDDLANWTSASFPDPHALTLLTHVKGGAQRSIVRGAEPRLETRFYATTEPGVAEHELVHAYCLQAFGSCGPDWYKEGMAELASHYVRGDRQVHCSAETLRVVQEGAAETCVRAIVEAGEFTAGLRARFETSDRNSPPEDEWLADGGRLVRTARRHYQRSWLLCHFLAHNPNYEDRFQRLGWAYLSGDRTGFQGFFRPVTRQLEFEFQLFQRHVNNGYRVDLCAWNWSAEFCEIDGGAAISSWVMAARGYQPSGLIVAKDQRYEYGATGVWQTDAGGPKTDADGDASGRGRLEGVVMGDFEIGDPIPLGASGVLTPSSSGRLYLRCHDDWCLLHDNRGRVKLRVNRCR